MPYKVHKMIEDRRNHTCGFFIPNGGFYWVLEMTFENHKQLSDISKRPGYSVDFVTGDEGFFDSEGYSVDPENIKVHKITKQVESYERRTRLWKGKEKPIKKTHASVERENAILKAQAMGLQVSQMASTQVIKSKVGDVSRKPQSTLSVT